MLTSVYEYVCCYLVSICMCAGARIVSSYVCVNESRPVCRRVSYYVIMCVFIFVCICVDVCLCVLVYVVIYV